MEDADLIERVRARVNELGLRPITAAKKAGLQRDYIRDLIKGKKERIDSDKVEKVALALEWTVAELLGSKAASQTRRQEALSYFERMSPETQDAVLHLLQKLVPTKTEEDN